MIRCTVGVMAHNEEDSIAAVLHALLAQHLERCDIVEIIVVASGCTDRTVELAEQIARACPIIRIDAEPKRTGKATAINRLISVARGEIIVLVGADTLPDPTAIEHLTRPFNDPAVGMTGARVIPINASTTFMGFAAHLLWRMHHRMAQRWPKLGELVAFRNVIPELPHKTATDEVALEALLTARHYHLVYTPMAVVYNRGPATLGDFLIQRRRIFMGHLQIAHRYGYFAASMPPSHLYLLMREAAGRYISLLPWMLGAMLLEGWARVLGSLDFLLGYNHHIWRPARSTKQLSLAQQTITLVVVTCQGDAIKAPKLARLMRRIPEREGALLWWDRSRREALFLLPPGDHIAKVLEQHVNRLMSYMTTPEDPAKNLVQSYRVVRFSSYVELSLAREANDGIVMQSGRQSQQGLRVR